MKQFSRANGTYNIIDGSKAHASRQKILSSTLGTSLVNFSHHPVCIVREK